MNNSGIILTDRAQNAKLDKPGWLSYRDVMSTIENAYLGDDAPVFSRNIRYAHKVNKSVLVIINAEDARYREKFLAQPSVTGTFEHVFRILPESQALWETLCTAVTISDPQALIAIHGNLDIARWHLNNPVESLKAVYDVRRNDRFSWNFLWRLFSRPVTSKEVLLLPLWQQLAMGIPIPPTHGDFTLLSDYHLTVLPDSPLRSVDLENLQQLCRGVVLNERLRILIDYLISHPQRVMLGQEPGYFQRRFRDDFRAGLLPPIVELEEFLLRLIQQFDPETIWLGHHVSGDLVATKICPGLVIDTCILLNLSGNLHTEPSLNTCASLYLKGEVADHNPKRDARATMKLCHLIMEKGLGHANEYLQTRKNNITSKGTATIIVDDINFDSYKQKIIEISPFCENVTIKTGASDDEKFQKVIDDIKENKHVLYAVEINTTEPQILQQRCDDIIRNSSKDEVTALYVVINYERMNSGTFLLTIIKPQGPSGSRVPC